MFVFNLPGNVSVMQKFVHDNIRPHCETMLAYTFGRGARVAIKCSDFNLGNETVSSKHDPKGDQSSWFTGTVTGYKKWAV